MKKTTPADRVREMRPEYDFRGGVRGKYADRLAAGATVVVLEPAVARAFPDSASVNAALRRLLRRGRTPRTPAKR